MSGWEAPVTVAELVNGGPLSGAAMHGTGENPVHQVRIVDEPAAFSEVTPHTAVVLIGAAASGGWAVEMAMRRAWEQAAACVIAPSGRLTAGSGEVLAERLGVTLIFVDEDPLVTAVRVASAAARPEAARIQLVARCATRLAESGASARRALGTLNAELPGAAVSFRDPYGRHLAGRRTPSPAPSRGDGESGSGSAEGGSAERRDGGPAAGRRDGGFAAGRRDGGFAFGSADGGAAAGRGGGGVGLLAEVVVPGPDGSTLGTLVAYGPARSPGWADVVRTVLTLAVAPLTAWAATERLAALDDAAAETALAQRLLDGAEEGDDAVLRAVALGWAVGGALTGYVVRPAGEAGVARSVLRRVVGAGPLFSLDDGWAGWSALPQDELSVRLARALNELPFPASAGIGGTVNAPSAVSEKDSLAAADSSAAGFTGAGFGGVRESLLRAAAAAFVAAKGAVGLADRLGPAELLAALPGGVLAGPAHAVLAPLLAADKDGTLLPTLAAVLDEGGASKAAERLGVHRNTVTTRLDRIRTVGFDPDDPHTRLALHLACHILLAPR